jgi:hypothetical protein
LNIISLMEAPSERKTHPLVGAFYRVEMAGIECHPLMGAPSERKTHPVVGAFHRVEMAGIEPASERLDPRTSTSVAG